MKYIINTTNLKQGGALQVAISFIYEAMNFSENVYHVFLSPTMEKEIDRNIFPENFHFHFFNNPSRFILFDKTIRELDKLEEQINPDCVFSIFGPTYWKPKSKHVMGFANGLYLYPDLPYMKNMDIKSKVFFNVKKFYHRQLLKRNADLYVVQTKDMQERFSKFVDIPLHLISVVSAKYHSVFNNKVDNLKLLPSKEKGEFWFVTISSYYSHKKLDIINELIDNIKNKKMNIKFVLTLPEKVFLQNFNDSKEYIINLGPVSLEECPYIYSQCDALFLPTLIESFSASYPEAMKMKKPILTSKYSFSTSVCKDAALYFNPYDIDDINKQINSIYTDKVLYKQLVDKGLKVVEELPSPQERAYKYLQLCKDLSNNVSK